MILTSQQKTTVRNYLTAHPELSNDDVAATALNALVSPSYFVWRTSVSRSDMYTTISDLPSSWDWTIYIAQTVPQQGGWTQMFMGDQLSMAAVNNRIGIVKIFGNANAETIHCFAVGRRACTVLEQLFVVAVASPPANSGNDGIAGNRGKTSNPDLLVVEGSISAQDVSDIRAGI